MLVQSALVIQVQESNRSTGHGLCFVICNMRLDAGRAPGLQLVIYDLVYIAGEISVYNDCSICDGSIFIQCHMNG